VRTGGAIYEFSALMQARFAARREKKESLPETRKVAWILRTEP
jgi:hypothetical protein